MQSPSHLDPELSRCQPLVDRLRSPHISSHEMQATLALLFDMCHISEQEHKFYQLAICLCGGVEALVSTAVQHKRDEEVLLWVFNVLGQLSFNNSSTSHVIGVCSELVDFVVEVLSSDHTGDKLKRHAIYSVTNVIANAWSVHQRLSVIVPHLVRLLVTSSTKELRSQCVLVLGNFAYNPDSRQALLDCHALTPLFSVVASDDRELLPTSAGVAITNLLAHITDNNSNSSNTNCNNNTNCTQTSSSCNWKPLLPANTRDMLCVRVVSALKLTLDGSDCPPGSAVFYTDWKLVMAIVNLAQHSPECRDALNDLNTIPLLRQCLTKATAAMSAFNSSQDHSTVASGRCACAECVRESKLVEAALKALWVLAKQ